MIVENAPQEVKRGSAQVIEELIPATLEKFFIQAGLPKCDVQVSASNISNSEFNVEVSLSVPAGSNNSSLYDRATGEVLEIKKGTVVTLTLYININDESAVEAFSEQNLIRKLIAAQKEKLRAEAERAAQPKKTGQRSVWFR